MTDDAGNPPTRPAWLAQFLEETKSWDARGVAPLQFDELVATARRNTGLDDFGTDDWQEALQVLLQSIERA